MSTSDNDILDARCSECAEAVILEPFDYSHSEVPSLVRRGGEAAAGPRPATAVDQRTGDEVV